MSPRRTAACALLALAVALPAGCGGGDEKASDERRPASTAQGGGAGTGTSATPTQAPGGARSSCQPTQPDALGPFYEPGAPVRGKVGEGYVLTGIVRDTRCRPLSGARLEFWLVNPEGDYDDAHRATVRADGAGRYRFESNRPVGYQGRPPHIHVRLSAPGHSTLVTQHYPREGQSAAMFDLVPAR